MGGCSTKVGPRCGGGGGPNHNVGSNVGEQGEKGGLKIDRCKLGDKLLPVTFKNVDKLQTGHRISA